MISLPGIVLIDDNESELDQLHKSFIKAGYPCFPINFINDDNENDSGINHVKLDFLNPRIVLTDLNLYENSKIDPKLLAGPIAEILYKIIKDGPYILYFWSKNEKDAEGVMEVLTSRFTDLKLPLDWGILSKSEFMNDNESLNIRVSRLIEDNKMFYSLFNWENKIYTAAQATTDSLFNLAKPSTSQGISDFKEKTTTKLQTMIAAIGNETLGIQNAREEPNTAIELGLEPVLHSHIRTINEASSSSIWRDAAQGIGTRLEDAMYNDVKAQLNSFLHIENLKENSPKNKRGSWLEFKSEYFEDEKNTRNIKKNFGKKVKSLINEEFFNISPVDSDKRDEVYSKIKLGFLELSAECDQAQRKTKMHRYFLSAMIPKEYEDFTFFREGKSNTAHTGIYRLPNLIVDGQEYIVKISFMYQVGAVPNSSKWLGKPVFRLKDQILSDISFKASQHAARPGIIRFD
ncbi:hypothetical protein [Marinomonas atlantica]|uniref:hypothetical protein n=1 Tax=Marinomonas atlantica TaxID=1806668 RepID=UPI0008359119|nr:hypothetical protein [Marinomonas atlantica]